MQLPTQFADIGHAQGADATSRDRDVPHVAEREGSVRDIGIGQTCEHGPRPWPHERERAPLLRHVREFDGPVARQMILDPAEVMGPEAVPVTT